MSTDIASPPEVSSLARPPYRPFPLVSVTLQSFIQRASPWLLVSPGIGLLSLILLIGASTSPAHAQQADSTLLRQFQRANAYVRAGETEEAIKLLEKLHAEAPTNTAFYRKLKEAYESVKRYDEALQLVEERIGDSPTVPLVSEKARLQYQKGNIEAANETWDRALRLAPKKAQTYRTVYKTLIDIRHFQKAIEVMQQGRTVLDRPDAFRTELAHLYGLDGQFEKAMREYVALLDESPERVGYVQNRLQTFVEQGQGIEASIEVLRQTVQESPLNQSYRQLLAWLHMEQNDYAAAFDVYRALDRLGDREGQLLFEFARKAANAQNYEVATTACETVLDRYPDAEVAPNVQKTLGDFYRQWAELETDSTTAAQDSTHFQRARTAYQTFLQTYSGHSAYPDALLQLGTLHLDAFRALDEAQATLEQLVSNHPQTAAAETGQYQLARLALFRDSLNRARLLFSRLANEAQQSDLADRARYELALLHFYEGEFEAALARTKATSQNTAADVANDAIELKTLIQENRGPDSLNTALQIFAQSRLSKRQRDYERALVQLDSLLQSHARHPLADNARFQQGTIHLARRDTSAALEVFRSLPRQYPRSPFADRSLYRAGTVLESIGRSAAATDIYDQLLTEYPKSLLASDARERLRALQRTSG